MADAEGMSKEVFLRMAALQGVDTSDAARMEQLYEHVQDVMGAVAQVRKLDLGDTEPANVFSPRLDGP